MKTKHWLLGYSIIIILLFSAVILMGYHVDPYFHYHKPLIDKYYYEIDNQRSQNNGIVKHFDYDAMITGTSMTVNFKTSEAEELFGGTFIKVPFYGGSYKEVNSCISTALFSNPDLKLVIRGLDMGYFISDKDTMRSDLGEFPTYLYDNNPFNDIKYLLNKDVQFGLSYNMISDSKRDASHTGITSFDDYSRSYDDESYGKEAVWADVSVLLTENAPQSTSLSDSERQIMIDNITQNIISTVEAYPNVTFYYFFPPYSIAYWLVEKENGSLEKQLQAEELVIELLLQHDNIRLYSFNTQTEVITNLDNYFGATHYGSWINSKILNWLAEDEGLITSANHKEYLRQEHDFLYTFDYNALFD